MAKSPNPKCSLPNFGPKPKPSKVLKYCSTSRTFRMVEQLTYLREQIALDLARIDQHRDRLANLNSDMDTDDVSIGDMRDLAEAIADLQEHVVEAAEVRNESAAAMLTALRLIALERDEGEGEGGHLDTPGILQAQTIIDRLTADIRTTGQNL